MTEVPYGRLQEIFHHACSLPAADRAKYLDRACARDAVLRREVELLLAHDARPIDFVERALDGGGAKFLARSSAVADPGVPARFLRYRILRVLGQGGMGIVYEAEQDDPHRRVALKTLHPGLTTPEMLARFRREAQVLGQLRHPGIAQIFEAGIADPAEGRQHFFAMELVHGDSLLEFARKESLGVEARLMLFAQVCDAVQHAHEKGVVHRDLKPENVLVDGATRQPKVLDFGVARVTDSDLQVMTLQTAPGQLIGTAQYMSPEQVAGEPHAIDHRTDIYSLGVILHELLTGRLPYAVRGKQLPEVMRIIRDEEPTRLSAISREFRGDVETIAAKALEKDKERRYASAADLAADIRRHLEDRPIVARPPSATYQLGKFARRNRAVAAGIAIAFIALSVATIVSMRQAHKANLAAMETQIQRAVAEARADALYERTIEGALRSLEYGRPDVALASFDTLGEPTPGAWEHRYLATRLDLASTWIPCEGRVEAVRFDGADVMTLDDGGRLQVADGVTGATKSILRLDGREIVNAAFSADGSRVVAICGSDPRLLVVFGVEDGERIASLAIRGSPAPRVAISSDGRFVAYGEKPLRVWSVETGTEIEEQVLRDRGVIAFTGSGDRLVQAYKKTPGDGRTYLATLDARSGVVKNRVIDGPYAMSHSVCATRDGTCAIVGLGDRTARLFDLTEQRELRNFTGHGASVIAVAIDPTERWLVTGSEDRTVRVWDLATGAPRAIFTGSRSAVRAVAFDDGASRVLAMGERSVRVFDLNRNESPGESSILRGHTSYVYGVGWCDGSHVVSGAWDGDLRVWNSATAECLATQRTDGGPVFSLGLSPDRNEILAGQSGAVTIWNISFGGAATAPLLRLDRRLRVEGNSRRVSALAATSDGRRVLAQIHDEAIVWDLERPDPIARIRARIVESERGAVALRPDGTLGAAGDRGQGVVLFDPRSGEVVRRITAKSSIYDLEFSPDGTRLAGGLRSGTARVWDVANGAVVADFDGHASEVFAVAFTHDGLRLATGSNDDSIMLWNLETGRRVLTLLGHRDYVFDLEFAPDDTALASGSGDGTVRIWSARTKE